MPLYMTQGTFTSDSWATQIRNPQNRAEQIRALFEANGGRLLSCYYAFGEYDAVIIYEMPDNVSTTAVLMASAGGGALKALKTTVLMSVEEAVEAMRRASGTGVSPPRELAHSAQWWSQYGTPKRGQVLGWLPVPSCAEQSAAPDCLQRPLRSHFQAGLMPGAGSAG